VPVGQTGAGNQRQRVKRQGSHRADYFTAKDTKSTKESKNKAPDSILELHDIEVDQEPDLNPCQLHIGQQLYFVD